MLNDKLIERVAAELNIAPRQARSALTLFEEGSTVPFVARYRKEVTGGLDDLQLRDLEERATYLEELEERRAAILTSIDEQGKLDDALRARIEAAETKQALEDLYLPYKPKRRTRATIAKERGLEPLADYMWGGASDADALAAAHAYVRPDLEINTTDDALRGARDILAERFAEDAEVRGFVRDYTHRNGTIVSTGKKGVEKATSKFADYFEFSQKLADIPSHRILAIRRAEAEEQVSWQINVAVDDVVSQLQRRITSGRNAPEQLSLVAEDAYKRLLAPSIEVELRLELKQRADEDAIRIFGSNLEQLLLGAPAGERVVLGLDPGFRTGVKAAIVSRTGSLQTTQTLYLHQEERFREQVRGVVQQHGVELIAIGNGTASRETEALTRSIVRELPEPRPQVVVVNEAGASVYSASDVAREEFPELDVSLRGAPSIARRLQDPLAELVKIDPKSIGVGQYQHDVNQSRLKKRLDDVVETCVNRVGVEVNTASPSLLSYVAGLGPMLAKNVVEFRDKRGGIRSRKELLEVPRLGAKAFEQAAGFLRVRGAAHPLDATAVHPERYEVVESMARDLGVDVEQLIANDELIDRIDPKRYISTDIGLPTLQDILSELRKPGRDPRDTFEPPQYRDDVKEPKDLQAGMELEGVVTNLVAFGAFVDVGVHQDGLVHVSQLADKFVKDPAEVVRVGQKVKVTVMSVDLERNRVALSMRKQQQPAAPAGQRVEKKREPKVSVPTKGTVAPNGMRFK